MDERPFNPSGDGGGKRRFSIRFSFESSKITMRTMRTSFTALYFPRPRHCRKRDAEKQRKFPVRVSVIGTIMVDRWPIPRHFGSRVAGVVAAGRCPKAPKAGG